MRPEHFLARISNLHRSLGLARRNRGNDLQRNDFALAAKSAAHQRLDHANLLHRHFQHQRKLVLQVVRHLRRGPHRQPSRLARMRIEFERSQRRMRLHRGVRHFIRNEARLGHMIRFGKALVRIAERMVIILLQIARLVVVNQISLRLHRLFRIEISRQYFILDVDQFQRLLRNRLRNSDHARHVIPNVTHLVERQSVLIVSDRENSVRIRRVFSNDHGHNAINSFGAFRIDALDPSMRIRRMQNLANQHAGDAKVVRVLAAARSLLRRVDHRDGLADNGERTHCVFVISPNIVIPSGARNLLSAGGLLVTLQPSPAAPPQSPTGSPHTSGCNRCTGTDCCSMRCEPPPPTDQDSPPTATSPSS